MLEQPDSHDNDLFQEAVQSLKLYRRAELLDRENNKELIVRDLYVDPLPNDFVLKKLLEPNTTFLIGRKGTGKSTIFQRAQYEILKQNNKTSGYIDIKTIFESSQPDGALLDKINKAGYLFDKEQLEKILLYRSFIRTLISEIKNQLQRELNLGFIERVRTKGIKNIFTSTDSIFKALDNLMESANDDNFQSILGIKFQQVSSSSSESKQNDIAYNASVEAGPISTSAKMGFSNTKQHGTSTSINIKFADILIKHFNIKEYINSLKEILNKCGVRNLYIFVDDFSELPADAMEIVVDTLLAPLNNWSDEFIKFKIAAYPNRIYFGEIDKTKIDESYLDTYKLYANGNPSQEANKGIDFTKRLVSKRIAYYCKKTIDHFFDDSAGNTYDDIWTTLYEASMGNPRTLGYLLSFAHESNLIYGKKITANSIKQAAERYFEEKIESYFQINKFLHESFQEKSSIYGLKDLLEKLVSKAKFMGSSGELASFKDDNSVAPTGHFHINQRFDSVLSTLELNFFLTKRQERSDKDRQKISIYCFNFGLCQRFGLIFGHPRGNDGYFVERFFDYSPIIHEYIQQNQELVCKSCNQVHDFSALDSIKMFGWMCPSCKKGKCILINSSKKYKSELDKINKESLLPKTEIRILGALYTEKRPLFAKDVACELDCSYQLIGKRAGNLHQKGLIKKEKNQKNRTEYTISELGQNSYFPEGEQECLNLQ